MNFHWLRPEWLLAILPLLILFIPLILKNTRDTVWQKACDPHLLPHLFIVHKTSFALLQKIMLFSGFLLTIIALAGPSYKTISVPIFELNTARVIVFDLSTAEWSTDLSPNRLTRARFKLLDLLQALEEGQTGLVLFTEQAFPVTPLTQDTQTIITQINELSPDIMPVQGYRLDLALLKAQTLLKQAGIQKGQIVAFSAQNPDQKAISIAKTLAQQGIITNVLSIGTGSGGPITTSTGELAKDRNGNILVSSLNSSAFSALAQAGQGQWWTLDTPTQTMVHTLNPLYATKNTSKKAAAQTTIPLDNGYIWIWPILVLGLWLFRRGRLEEFLQ